MNEGILQVNKYERAAQQESVLPGGYGMNQEELKKRLKGLFSFGKISKYFKE